MTTDTKAVARWDLGFKGLSDRAAMLEHYKGRYVLFTDHERVVGELQSTLEWSSSELCSADSRISELRTSLVASRAEVEGLKKDVKRWGHARKLFTVDDIFNRQRELHAWQNLVSEEECERADKAIDAAMENGND